MANGSKERGMGAADDLGLGDVFDPFKVVESVSGQGAAKATKDAARVQAAAGAEAAAKAEGAQLRLEENLQPFSQFGVSQGIGALPNLFNQQSAAINDPSASVLNNPFFQALAGQQEQRLLASQAARGKVGSGETGDDLQRNLLLLGNQFAQQDIGNIQTQIGNQFNAAAIGQNAAAQTGVAGINTANTVGGILGNVGNVNAASIVGQQKAQAQGINNIIGLGSGLFSDQRLKENIRFSHKHPKMDIRIYTWDWTEEAKPIVGDQDNVGPIAQELMISRPDLVVTDQETGYLKVLM